MVEALGSDVALGWVAGDAEDVERDEPSVAVGVCSRGRRRQAQQVTLGFRIRDRYEDGIARFHAAERIPE